MDLTSYGQIEIYNSFFNGDFIPCEYTPTQCILNKYSYCVTYIINNEGNKIRVPIMFGSRLHTHEDDNPLQLNGYFIVDGLCKSVSNMYVYDKMLYTNDRAYISNGRVTILSMGRYEIYNEGKKSAWYLPLNYELIYSHSNFKELKIHLDIVAQHINQRSSMISNSDAYILCLMFEEYLGLSEYKYVPIKRLITAGELINDTINIKGDIIKCFRTHTWTVKNIQNVNSVSEDMKHYSMVGDIEAIRRVTYPTVREITRMKDRYVEDYNKYIFCPVQTSDGTLCGTIMYLCLGVRITMEGKYTIIPGEDQLLFINGKYHGKCTDVIGNESGSNAISIYNYNGAIHVLTSIGRICSGYSLVSYAVSLIPFRTHNPAVRSMFTSSMIKQAISMDPKIKNGWYHDTKYLINGEQPTVGLPFPYPCGWNVNVAIMPYFGYNVEDAIVISKSLSEKFTTEKVSIYSTVLETKYDKITHKYVNIGDKITKGNILFTAYHPKEIETIERVRSITEGIVVDIHDSDRCYSVKVVQHKKLEVGDKMSNRHGQKGVISLIVDDEYMPYTKTIDGVGRVELIMNPHTFPTRKTMGQLLEMGNNTYKIYLPNTNNDIIVDEPIIVGKCYYMALRHQVSDKIQYRNNGKIDNITHQAISGKSRGGGLRFGHMERDIMLAVGAHKELEQLWSIDKIKITSCNNCGIIDQLQHTPCKHNRVTVDAHQYLLICLCLLRANGKDIRYYPSFNIPSGETKIESKMGEYEIVDFDLTSTPKVKVLDDLYFGFTYILELKHYISKNNEIIPIIPSILRTQYLEGLYRRMFNRTKNNDIIKEIRSMLSSKNGFYHTLVEGHRVNHCLRSVIVPAPYLPPNTVEIPLGCDIGKSYGLLNRQPSLDVSSIMSVKLVVGKNKTIGIHPNLCKAFNADFDGDEMCIYGMDDLCNKLPIIEEPTQDYKHIDINNGINNVNDFTYKGLTATKKGIEYMIKSNIKGSDIDYKHIYDNIGDVIVNGKVIGNIQHCYLEGLTEEEWYIQSKAGREGASSIGINTPFIGDLNSYVNRTLI